MHGSGPSKHEARPVCLRALGSAPPRTPLGVGTPSRYLLEFAFIQAQCAAYPIPQRFRDLISPERRADAAPWQPIMVSSRWVTEYIFEWDPAKAAENVRKHGVTFEEASHVFNDHLAQNRYDNEHSSSEQDRWVTLGRSRRELLVVVHTFVEHMRTVTVRIISARLATRNERRSYEETP